MWFKKASSNSLTFITSILLPMSQITLPFRSRIFLVNNLELENLGLKKLRHKRIRENRLLEREKRLTKKGLRARGKRLRKLNTSLMLFLIYFCPSSRIRSDFSFSIGFFSLSIIRIYFFLIILGTFLFFFSFF